MSKRCPGCKATWFAIFNRRVHAAVRELVLEIHHTIPMSLTSSQTVTFLEQVLNVLKERKNTTAEAIRLKDEAIAALEPLRSENSRINTALLALESEKNTWLEADAREDAALEAVVAEINAQGAGPAVEPPVETPPVETPPTEGGPTGEPEGGDAPTGDNSTPVAGDAAGDDSDNV